MKNEVRKTSCQLFEAVDFGMALKLLKKTYPHDCSCDGYGFVLIDYLEKEMDGVFPNKASWTRYSNSVDNDGGAYLLSRMLGGKKKLKADFGDYAIKRDAWYEDTCTISFKKPIKMVVGGYSDANGEWINIVEEVNYLKGQITYEWLWKQGEKIASSIEVFLSIKNYGKTSYHQPNQIHTVVIYAVLGEIESVESFTSNEEAHRYLLNWANKNNRDGLTFNSTSEALDWFRNNEEDIDYTIELFEHTLNTNGDKLCKA